jgi:hypothetical protein
MSVVSPAAIALMVPRLSHLAGVPALLDDVWRLPPDKLDAARPKVLAELREFHYRLIQEHLEKDLKSHHVLEEMLRETRGKAR